MPESFQLITIDIDDDVRFAGVDSHRLPDGWAGGTGVSRAIGDDWLKHGTSLLLRVPSVIIPDTCNMLINPSHPDAAKMRIIKTERIPLDRRLARR